MWGYTDQRNGRCGGYTDQRNGRWGGIRINADQRYYKGVWSSVMHITKLWGMSNEESCTIRLHSAALNTSAHMSSRNIWTNAATKRQQSVCDSNSSVNLRLSVSQA